MVGALILLFMSVVCQAGFSSRARKRKTPISSLQPTLTTTKCIGMLSKIYGVHTGRQGRTVAPQQQLTCTCTPLGAAMPCVVHNQACRDLEGVGMDVTARPSAKTEWGGVTGATTSYDRKQPSV